MHSLVSNTPVMLALTFGTYLLGVWAKKKSGIALLHPLFICIPAIIAVLLVFDIPCDFYMESNQIVSFVLGPCVVALGLKLYDHRKIVMDITRPNTSLHIQPVLTHVKRCAQIHAAKTSI